MKTHRMLTVLRLLVLALIVGGLNAKPLSAQDYKGKFTLSSVTRWGQALLPAGDYTLTLEHELDGVVTVFRGTQTVARIQGAVMSNLKSARSEIVTQGGAVREVNLPTMGASLHYSTPNPGRRAAPQELELAQIIPLAKVGAGR